MLRKDTMFVQKSFGVRFVSDLNGCVQFATYGSDEEGYSPLVKEPLQAVDGGVLDLIILWCLGFKFGVKDAVNDFLDRVVPIVKSRLRQLQGWWSADDVSNMLTDIWMVLSGAKPRSKPYNPQKSQLSTWIGKRCLAYVSEKQRQKRLAKRLAGLSLILDDDTELSSIGDKQLFGLIFEPSDPDTIRGKWTKMSAKPAGILENIVATENEVAIERILSKIDPIDRKILEQSFLEGLSCQDIRDSLERLGLATMTMNGVRKRIIRIVNGLRQKLQPGSPPVVGLKGRHGRVAIMEEIET